ncbi:tyrosine-type recombinase/integrase [Fusicatenibacter sp. CLA-AA-H213]|nr:tyrosine-type recombinase/integrase [Fusicatenibacter sp. CLA-AA-H213]
MGRDLQGKELGRGIRQRSDGRYEARVYTKGVKKPVCFYDQKLPSLKKKVKDFKKNKAPLAQRYNPQISVANWFDEWMHLYVVPENKTKTVENYVNGFERIREYIGYIKLIDVTPSTISYVLDALLKEGYARTTVQQSLSVMRQFFKSAFNGGLISTNPCVNIRFSIKSPDDIPTEDDDKCISDYDIQRFLKVCQRRRYYELFFILFHTGMRVGELCALGWKDVDFQRRIIHVRKTINKVYVYYDQNNKRLPERQRKKQVTSPKKIASYRNIPMTPVVAQAFLDWKEKQDGDKETYGKKWGNNNELMADLADPVFTTAPGNPYLPSAAYGESRCIIEMINAHEAKQAQLENRDPVFMKLTPHMLRHTFVTHCVEAGMNYAAIRKITGHADIKMTEYYTHLEDDFLKTSYQEYEKKYASNTQPMD